MTKEITFSIDKAVYTQWLTLRNTENTEENRNLYMNIVYEMANDQFRSTIDESITITESSYTYTVKDTTIDIQGTITYEIYVPSNNAIQPLVINNFTIK